METTPFLDPFSSVQGGRISEQGQRLTQLNVPSIRTLIYKPEEMGGSLLMVDVTESLNQAGITPRQPVLVRDEDFGIELNLNILGTETVPLTQVNPLQTQTQSVGRPIPKNYQEARYSLNMITAQRTGRKNDVFGITELRQIAKNLSLPSSGNKDVLANRIRTAIIEYFRLQE